MSSLTERDKLHYIALSTGEKYGIKPEKKIESLRSEIEYSITLPIRFENETEVEEFEKQVKELYNDIEISTNKIRIIALEKRAWSLCDLFPFRGPFIGYVEIATRPSILVSYFIPRCKDCNSRNWSSKKLDWTAFEKECKVVVDKIVRDTILGKKLKKYWIENERIPSEDAQKRLEEITSYASI
jgi:hypothetical protein